MDLVAELVRGEAGGLAVFEAKVVGGVGVGFFVVPGEFCFLPLLQVYCFNVLFFAEAFVSEYEDG